MARLHTHTALFSTTPASYASSVISQMKFAFLPHFATHLKCKETRPKPMRDPADARSFLAVSVLCRGCEHAAGE